MATGAADIYDQINVHCKKRFTTFPSPASMSLTKLPLGRTNSVMTSLFPPRESLVMTSQLGTGNSRTFFLRCTWGLYVQNKGLHILNTVLANLSWYSTLQRHNTENLKQIFPGKELRGYSPNSYIRVSVSDLYIPLIGLPILLEENRWAECGNI